ncbi:hypothetical protein MCHI_003229 [Candidatus Magnetoovum chiemensis]|nr:hypothetical protein MCHI_003229 [Candidatus Magnetoovum chiemensis]
MNNLPVTEDAACSAIDRALSEGIIPGFGGTKPYSLYDALYIYNKTHDDVLLRYIKKDINEDSTDFSSQPFIEPLTQTSFNAYYFSTDVENKERYCLENQEGTCIDKGFTAYIKQSTQARLKDNITVFVEGRLKQSSEQTDAMLNKGYIKLRTGNLSWQLGKDSMWIGHGSHGSFLLSNNAEPFFMLKIKTEDPFRFPWLLNKIGDFQYTFFHGWLDDFNLLGYRIAWQPMRILELGLNQTASYSKDRNFKIYNWPRILFSSQENVPGSKYNNDQRASLDVALSMPFLSKLPYLKGGKLYAEYAGEDTYAWWQKEDGTWYGPLGFEFLGEGIMSGIFVTSESTDFRFEYSENYIDHPIFYDIYKANNLPYAQKTTSWYRGIPFVYKDALMGHNMGPEAEDKYYEITHRYKDLVFTLFYDRQRQHIYNKISSYELEKTTPQIKDQYGINVSYKYKQYELSALIIYNKYNNTDINPDPLTISIEEGTDSSEWINGIGLNYYW